MVWTEFHHGWIVSEFYRLLTGRWAGQGRQAFLLATRTYGEQRGKRMAMRATADGRPLGLLEYFAYGEYGGGEELFELEMWGETGVVHEKVTRCPWAEVFASRKLRDCGIAYCEEIDRAIVRGFNPVLELETASTQHNAPCCRFYFREQGIGADTLSRADALEVTGAAMPMSYHCAHVYHTFAAVARGTFGQAGEALAREVCLGFGERYGVEAQQLLEKAEQLPFDTIMSQEEWMGYDSD